MGNVAGPIPARPTVGLGGVDADPAARRRRPSGEPPPLPRTVSASTRWYLVTIAATASLEIALSVTRLRVPVTRADDATLKVLAAVRSEPLRHVLDAVVWAGSSGVVRVLSWATIAVLLVSRRFRHLFVYLGVVLAAVLGANALALLLGRMRPTGVQILGGWSGYSHPSVPVAALAAVSVSVVYTIVPRGAWRNRMKWVVAAIIAAVCLARLGLAVDHPSDVLAALGIGWALPVVVYRMVTPDDVFPVRYRKSHGAHLDVAGPRGEAIIRALDQQLGIHVLALEPFGLAGSAGSTPLRLHVQRPDGSQTTLFAKLYAVNHLRSDRSYKLARMVRYGRLEDEKPLSTVRRLAEYEDHMLRLLRDVQLPTPRPYGFVEITPEREYVVVMQFVDNAQDLTTAPIGDPEIDSALGIVRRLWQAGVAHRDIKPSNLLVRDGQVVLIDVAFATVRPTPWRQAVDLANMMLTLALVSTPERVYARAILMFSPIDVAEAFAATRSLTIPTQLRTRLRADGRDLIARFRELAPQRRPVTIQLWSVRRVALTLCLVAAMAIAVVLIYSYARLAGLL
jgi:tRNA A-37 threonylcarbamoyl transferase component Bud32